MSNEKVIAFHDKEIVEKGVHFLKIIIKKHINKKFCFVRELNI